MAKYFIYDPNTTPEFFKSEAELHQAMEDYDLKQNYLDDGWSEEVENVIAGFIPDGHVRNDDEESDDWEDEYDFYQRHATHRAMKCDERSRPDKVDEDGYDDDGTYWGDWDEICNYEFQEIGETKHD